MKINGIDMPNFSIMEFPEDPAVFADRDLLRCLQSYRTQLGAAVTPSLAPGGLARIDDDSKSSQHYALNCHSKAIDVFTGTSIFKSWVKAIHASFWGGIGVYFDTKNNKGIDQPMLHLDRRDGAVLWYRHEGEYSTPNTNKNFYSDLSRLFAAFQ